jgi:hypothetical protein
MVNFVWTDFSSKLMCPEMLYYGLEAVTSCNGHFYAMAQFYFTA